MAARILRLGTRGSLALRLHVSHSMVDGVMMARREQPSALEIFDAGSKFDGTALGFPTNRGDPIRDRHWPLLGKGVQREL